MNVDIKNVSEVQDASDNTVDNKKYFLSATVVSYQVTFCIYNNHVVIPLNTVKNCMKSWKTIHKAIGDILFE